MDKFQTCAFAIKYKRRNVCGCSGKWETCSYRFDYQKVECEFFIKLSLQKIKRPIPHLNCCPGNCIFTNNPYKPFINICACKYRTKNKMCIISHN